LQQPLDGKFTIDDSHDDGTILCFEGPINNQLYPRWNVGHNHGFLISPEVKGGGRMFNNVFIKIDGFFYVIRCRRGKAYGYKAIACN
jgi:hypothetical protein